MTTAANTNHTNSLYFHLSQLFDASRGYTPGDVEYMSLSLDKGSSDLQEYTNMSKSGLVTILEDSETTVKVTMTEIAWKTWKDIKAGHGWTWDGKNFVSPCGRCGVVGTRWDHEDCCVGAWSNSW